MKEISINSQWLPSTVAIDTLVSNLLNPILNGEVDTLKATATLVALQEAIDKVTTVIKPLIIDELHKYPSKEPVVINGNTFKLKEAGTKYDYTNCGDTILLDLLKELEVLNEKIKERQKFLKSIKEVEIVVDKNTGELLELRPPIKTSVTTFTLTFNKGGQNG